MKVRLFAALVLAFVAHASFAQSTPSEASINELLQIMNARAALDNVAVQVEGVMRNAMQQALAGRVPTPEQQKVMEEVQAHISQLYKEEMSWEKMQPMYQRIYQASFTQEEVDGMLKFYKSPPGQAVVKKMPLVMQNTMSEMQKMMVPMLQKAQVAAREAQEKLSADKANQSNVGTEKSSATPSKPKK